MNLLDLYRDDVSGNGKVVSVSGGREWRGPCPVCGGEDRFGVWPDQGNGSGSFFCGRQKGGGNGCGIGGDAIQYLRDVRKYSYPEACDCLGIAAQRGGESLRYKVPVAPKTSAEAIFEPKKAMYPEEVVDPALWHEHGMKFVEECHQAILGRPISIAYLMARGIDREQIVKYRLGFHAGSTRGDVQYQPTFRPWPSWGLKPETREGGKFRMLILPAGLVIPYIVDGQLHRITIRLIKPDPKMPKKKYHYVRGSIRDLWVSNPTAKAFVLQEAEFDCIAVDGAAGDLVGTIGLGSTGTKPDARAAAILQESLSVLDALDFDNPVRNPHTGRMERPGTSGGKWWKEQYPQYKRWPVPKGKDAGEAFAAGVDLRTWIMAGLPPIFHDVPVVHRPASVEKTRKPDQVPKPEQPDQAPVPDPGPDVPTEKDARRPEQRRIETILKEKKFPQTEEVQELKKLLTQAAGFIRIYGRGTGIGPVVSPEWSEKNQEKRSRISWLLFNSASVARALENLDDGMYGPNHLSM